MLRQPSASARVKILRKSSVSPHGVTTEADRKGGEEQRSRGLLNDNVLYDSRSRPLVPRANA